MRPSLPSDLIPDFFPAGVFRKRLLARWNRRPAIRALFLNLEAFMLGSVWRSRLLRHFRSSARSTPRKPRRPLALEPLEDRLVPAIITVTSVDDSIAINGFVTLREALTAANTNAVSGDAAAGDPGLDTIKFNIAGAPGTVHTIQLMSALPAITDPVFIDGYSQLGASPNTLADGDNAFLAIELDGINAVV